MCHSPLDGASVWVLLSAIDQQEARRCQAHGCPHCGGKLHVSNYPRKPRGINRAVLGDAYQTRWSFCCARDGCRRRSTPASVRFLGRKVYLGIVITLISALQHGLTPARRERLINELDLCPQTIHRWRCWWRREVPATRHWRYLAGLFSPPVQIATLPGSLLARVQGESLSERLLHLLVLIRGLTGTAGVHAM